MLSKEEKSIKSLSFGSLVVWATVLFYAPLSATYFINPDPLVKNFQDWVLEKLVSVEFAHGIGSGYLDGHINTYEKTWLNMLFHSLAGTIAILMGLAQFNDTLRRNYPQAHRFTGYVYLSCSLLIPLSAMNYLIKTGPTKIFSGSSFALILWLLALSTLTSGVLALQAAIAFKFERHRDIMALNFAMMLSAPLLRIGWILTPLFWDETKETINMIEGIWAGPFLFSCVAYYIRTTQGGRKVKRKSTVSKKTLIGVFIAFVTGTLVLLSHISTTVWWRPEMLFWWTVPLFSVQFSFFSLLYLRAKDQDTQQFWLVHLIGLFLVPVTSATSFYITKGPLQGDIGMAWYGAAVGGWSTANFIGSIANVYLTTYARDAITSKKARQA